MRNLIIAALAVATLAPAANAQTYGEVRRDRREVQDDRRDLRDARLNGDRGDVRAARQELREDRRETREDRRDVRDTRGGYDRGAYNAPRGYRYRPVSIGYRFQPNYYARDYWINDYASYRLARPAFSQRWVRYGNDVVLVDVRSGRVVSVRNRFFR